MNTSKPACLNLGKIMIFWFYSIHNGGFVSFGINYLYVFRDRCSQCRVLFSDWSISKMNITNLALDQSERTTEYWRSVNLVLALRLPGRGTRTSDAHDKVNLERFVVDSLLDFVSWNIKWMHTYLKEAKMVLI